jgi:TolA-binding protein
MWRFAGGAALAAIVISALTLLAVRSERRVAFVVGEHRAEGVVGGFIAATAAPLPVTFSDGTRVTLEPGARGRIVSTTSVGAELVVESGRAVVAVVPRPGNRWQVSTGPFVVHVTGTRFEVEWHPDRDAFALVLHEGHVRITGCAFGEGQAVKAGERVDASCGRGEFRVSRLDARAEATSPTASEQVAEPAGHEKDAEVDALAPMEAKRTPSGQTGPLPARAGAPAAGADWLSLSRRGRFREAFAAAAPRLGQLYEGANASELLLLGDAARLSGHPAEARRSYLALRERFAGSEGAALGAFQLGRADFDLRGDYASAERWLAIYLREEPEGPLAAPAMGRLIEAEVHLAHLGEARALAERYLTRFPKGPHVETARRVLSPANPAPR